MFKTNSVTTGLTCSTWKHRDGLRPERSRWSGAYGQLRGLLYQSPFDVLPSSPPRQRCPQVSLTC